jgi:hypothetical protein
VFRTVAELDIRYRRSPLSVEGPHPPRRGPRAGDRLPDAPVVGDRQSTSLHRATAAPGWHLLLCGPGRTWPAGPVEQLSRGRGGLLTVHRLGAHDEPGALHDPDGHALRRLGLDADAAALYLVRPDGHVGFRSGADGWPALVDYLDRWLPPS